MFMDSIIICSESREPAGEGLERRRYVQEEREMKCSSSRSKAEHMCVNERDTGATVKMQEAEIVKVEEFKYVGSTMPNNGQCRDKCQQKDSSKRKFRQERDLL